MRQRELERKEKKKKRNNLSVKIVQAGLRRPFLKTCGSLLKRQLPPYPLLCVVFFLDQEFNFLDSTEMFFFCYLGHTFQQTRVHKYIKNTNEKNGFGEVDFAHGYYLAFPGLDNTFLTFLKHFSNFFTYLALSNLPKPKYTEVQVGPFLLFIFSHPKIGKPFQENLIF